MLDTVHHLAIRLCTGAFRTSPIQSLYAESGEPSLSFRRDKLSLQLYTRVLAVPGSPTAAVLSATGSDHYFNRGPRRPTSLGYRVRLLLREIALPELNVTPALSFMCPPYSLDILPLCPGIIGALKSDTPSSILRDLHFDHSSLHSEHVAIFTDGSRSDAGVGFSVVFPTHVKARRLPDSASIYTAELHAILFAVASIVRLEASEYVIYSDSRSALQCVCDPFSPNPIVGQVHIWLRFLRRKRKLVHFCWVPAHVGIPGNERADLAAKAIISDTEVVRPQTLPHKDYYPEFHVGLRRRWQDFWSLSHSVKLRAVKDSISPWHTSCRRDRRQETALTRLRIGHTRLTHGHLLTGTPPPYCDDCVVPLTVEHILVECPTYATGRARHFGADGVTAPISLRDILGDSETSARLVLSFVMDIAFLTSI